MTDRAIYSNLPVYRDCYAVMLEFAKMRSELPRDTRYTIAQDLSRVLVDMMVTIYRANSSRSDKARLIAELRRLAVELQIYFRLLSDMHQLGAQKAAFFMEKVASIGKQLAAWHKSAVRGADFMKREVKCHHYGRYVDDAFVVSPSKEELFSIVPKARDFLRDRLGLELNEDKVRVVDAYKGVEFLGAYVKPYRTYPATRSLCRLRGRMKSLDWSESPRRIQARVNSMLGVLSHYDCYLMRKVLVHEAGLREFGEMTDDCLRFYPDWLSLVGRSPRDRRGRRGAPFLPSFANCLKMSGGTR